MPVPAISGAGYFFVACMTPKTTTANKLSNPRTSNVVMLSPPRLCRLGGLAVPLLPNAKLLYKIGAVHLNCVMILPFYIFFALCDRSQRAFFLIVMYERKISPDDTWSSIFRRGCGGQRRRCGRPSPKPWTPTRPALPIPAGRTAPRSRRSGTPAWNRCPPTW